MGSMDAEQWPYKDAAQQDMRYSNALDRPEVGPRAFEQRYGPASP